MALATRELKWPTYNGLTSPALCRRFILLCCTRMQLPPLYRANLAVSLHFFLGWKGGPLPALLMSKNAPLPSPFLPKAMHAPFCPHILSPPCTPFLISPPEFLILKPHPLLIICRLDYSAPRVEKNV